jgi:hypothetical protein
MDCFNTLNSYILQIKGCTNHKLSLLYRKCRSWEAWLLIVVKVKVDGAFAIIKYWRIGDRLDKPLVP